MAVETVPVKHDSAGIALIGRVGSTLSLFGSATLRVRALVAVHAPGIACISGTCRDDDSHPVEQHGRHQLPVRCRANGRKQVPVQRGQAWLGLVGDAEPNRLSRWSAASTSLRVL